MISIIHSKHFFKFSKAKFEKYLKLLFQEPMFLILKKGSRFFHVLNDNSVEAVFSLTAEKTDK